MTADPELERLLKALDDAEDAYYAAAAHSVSDEEFDAADLAYDAAEADYDNYVESLR
jgi:NAD-dependent DNA ligase